MSNNILEVNGLNKSYISFSLHDVTFSVKEGEIMGFIGRNGAGKSTTLKSILNVVHKSSGDVKFFGLDFSRNEKAIKERIGFVSGGVDYYTQKKIKTIVDVTKKFYKNWDENAYQQCLKLFNLDENKTPKELSQGMRVKFSLTLALSHNADFLILDEPTSGLDPVSRDDLLDTFLALADNGKTILFSTHITSDLDKCADSITYIQNGEIIASEDIKTFKNKYVYFEIEKEKLTDDIKTLSDGIRRIKDGFSVLISRDKVDILNFEYKDATLEDIMVHLEKEGV